MPDMDPEDIGSVRAHFLELQDRICGALEGEDAGAHFHRDAWDRGDGGGGITRVLVDGPVFEQAGVGFSHVRGTELPAASTSRRPELAGRAFEAMGVSVVVHPATPTFRRRT
jgi:coproporphyrinogen III oxidase